MLTLPKNKNKGRKRLIPAGSRPAHSIFLDCAGAFFLKGVELEIGLLTAINRLLATSTESAKARKALKLAQQINALLLYAPVVKLKSAQDIVGYKGHTLPYLAEQKGLPQQVEIEQYLRFLAEQIIPYPLIIKEVTKACAEALIVRIDLSQKTFYLDAQCRMVWPTSKIPRALSTSLNKTKSYIKGIFQTPSPQRPLILQIAPGYTFLPPEMFDLIQCFEQAEGKPISRITVMGKFGENLALWQELKPQGKCYFIFPLSPWQYARLQGTQIVRDFQQYFIGPKKEPMAVADAKINLFNSQLNTNVEVRAALVRRKAERLALVTNIPQQEERYIRKIADEYFSRWPDAKVKTYYDLLEEAHQEALARSQKQTALTPLLTMPYDQRPMGLFKLFLEQLNRCALNHYFPSEYAGENLTSMCEKFYQHCGFLKIKQRCWEVTLHNFAQKDLQEACAVASQRFNQSGIRLPDQKRLRINLMPG